VAYLPNGEIAVRNPRFPSAPALVVHAREIAAFLAAPRTASSDPRDLNPEDDPHHQPHNPLI